MWTTRSVAAHLARAVLDDRIDECQCELGQTSSASTTTNAPCHSNHASPTKTDRVDRRPARVQLQFGRGVGLLRQPRVPFVVVQGVEAAEQAMQDEDRDADVDGLHARRQAIPLPDACAYAYAAIDPWRAAVLRARCPFDFVPESAMSRLFALFALLLGAPLRSPPRSR